MANGNDPFGDPVPLKSGSFGTEMPITPAMAISSGASPEDIQAATQRDAKKQATSYRVMRMAPLESQSTDAYLRKIGYDPDNPNASAADKQVTLAPHIYQEQSAPDLQSVQQDAHKINNALAIAGGGSVLGPAAQGVGELPFIRSAGNVVANALRNENGAIRPVAKAASRIGGAVLGHYMGVPEGELIGAITGPSILDSMIPSRQFEAAPEFINNARNEMYTDIGDRLMRRGREQAALDRQAQRALSSAPEEETVPFKPFKPSESVSRQMRGYGTYDPLQSSPSYAQAPSRSTVGAGASSGQSGATGSAAQPFEPLIWQSPEDAAAHDFQMQNIQRQASSAGKYHAAQGAAGKRTNLQQRIGRKGGFFYGDQ